MTELAEIMASFYLSRSVAFLDEPAEATDNHGLPLPCRKVPSGSSVGEVTRKLFPQSRLFHHAIN